MAVVRKQEQPPSVSFRLKLILCVWIGLVMLLFLVLFWPPLLGPLAQRLGIHDLILQLQAWLQPFLTSRYLS